MAQEKGWIKTPVKAFLREVNLKTEIGTEELLGLSKKKGVLRKKEFEQRSSEAVSYIGYKKVKSGQLISNKMQAWNGMFGISAIDGITSPDYAIYDFSPNVESRFIEYIVRTNLYAGEFLCRSRGMGTGFLRLNPSEFLSTHVWLPDITIQTEIADFLDRETARIDQLIEKKKKLVSMLKERFDSQINEVMSQFTPRKLKMIASARLSNVDKHIYKDEIAVNVVHYTDVYYNDVITKNTTLPKGSVTAFEKQKFSLKGGEVLVTKDSETPDDIAIPVYIDGVKENTVCGYHLAIIKPNTTLLDGRFIFWGLKTKRVRDYFSLAAQGVTRFGIPIGKISDCPLPYTSNLEIQKKIAHELFVKNEMKLQLNRAIKRSIDRLKQLRASLITEAVTGQLDIELWKKGGIADERLDNIEEAMRT
ncbi:TPA: hypothetical protein JBH59_05405 [Legionella pneumophila]|nr:hypothetical protein [Legionella pneumophila]HDI4897659.1 restriction endonuclease subunit S [Legionella pneumophila]